MPKTPPGPLLAAGTESCADLLRCMYNLTDLDMEALDALRREGAMKAEELADLLERDRSTVYRALQKLVSCQVATKETRNLDRGGYYHVYAPVPSDLLRTRLERCIEDWYSRMRSLLDHLDEGPEGG